MIIFFRKIHIKQKTKEFLFPSLTKCYHSSTICQHDEQKAVHFIGSAFL